MVRRTKADALATRDQIIDCAELLFVRQGVSATTLQHIAAQAGVTRGAIYWHFEDKAAVFNAMMQRAKTPLESAMLMFDAANDDPLGSLYDYAMLVFRLTVNDPRSRRVFEIATMKIEYTDEMTAVRHRRVEMARHWMERAENCIRAAAKTGQTPPSCNTRAAAQGLWAVIDGLLRAWLIDPESFPLIETGELVVGNYLQAIRSKK